MALFDSLGNNASGLYGDIFTDPQKAALGQRGLLGFLGGMANSGALNYTMPTITGQLPGGFAKGLAGGMAGMGEAQDAAAMNALKAQLVGLQGQDLASKIEMNKWMMNDTDSTTKLLQQIGLIPGGTPAAGGAPSSGGASQTAGADTGISDPRGLAPYIADTAKKYGIDPTIALKVAASEGLANPVGDGGKSGGAFQLYTGVPGAVGSRFKKDTGLDPLDPANEKATIDYAMKTVAQEGWGAWNGAKKLGITGFNGIGQPRPVQLASAGGDLPQSAVDAATSQAAPQATPGTADMSAIPRAAPGTNISVPGMPQGAPTAPAGVQMAQAAPPGAPMPMAAPQGVPGAPGMAMAPDAQKQQATQQLLTALGLKDARINTVIGRSPYQGLMNVLQGTPEYKAAIAGQEELAKAPYTDLVKAKLAMQLFPPGSPEYQLAQAAMQKAAGVKTFLGGERQGVPLREFDPTTGGYKLSETLGLEQATENLTRAAAAGPATFKEQNFYGPGGVPYMGTARQLPEVAQLGGAPTITGQPMPSPTNAPATAAGTPAATPATPSTRPEAMAPTFPVQTPSGTKDISQVHVGDMFPNGQGIPQPPQPPAGFGYGPPTDAQKDQQKKDQDRAEVYAKESAENQKQYQDLGHIRDILNRGLVTSNLAPLWKELGNVAQSVGYEVKFPTDPNDAYAFDKAATDLTFAAVKKMGGRVLVSEIEGFSRANPSGVIPRAANYSIVNDVLASGKWQDERARLAQEYLTAHPGAPLSAFETQFNKMAPLDTVTEHYRDTLRSLGAKFPGDKTEPAKGGTTPSGIRWSIQ